MENFLRDPNRERGRGRPPLPWADCHESGRGNRFFYRPGIEEFYISFWKNFADSLSAEIIFPTGESSGIIRINNQVKNIRMGNLVLTIIYGQPSHYAISQEIFFLVRATDSTVKAGLWKLRIIAGRIVDGDFKMWLPTLEQVTDETYFSNPTSEDTMTIPSTAYKMIVWRGTMTEWATSPSFPERETPTWRCQIRILPPRP
jgi:hypothetical protein